MVVSLSSLVVPNLRPLAERLLKSRPEERLITAEGLRANSANLRALMGQYRSKCNETVVEIDGEGTGPFIGRLYEPRTNSDSETLVVYVHGGGWAYGDAEFVADVSAYAALATDSPVLSISYRLAPEHRSPAAEIDVVSQLRWIAEDPSRVKPGARKVVVVGDSAGGYLALRGLMSIEPKARKSVSGLVLVYPVVDPPSGPEHYASNADGITLTANRMHLFWNLYQPNPAARVSASDIVSEEIPLSSLPPVTILTAGLDPLRDEGLTLAIHLDEVGVLEQAQDLPGQIHGLMWMRGITDEADLIFNAIAARVRNG